MLFMLKAPTAYLPSRAAFSNSLFVLSTASSLFAPGFESRKGNVCTLLRPCQARVPSPASGQDNRRCGTAAIECAEAGTGSLSRCDEIVHEYDVSTGSEIRAEELERSAHIPGPLRVRKLGLALRIPRPDERIVHNRQIEGLSDIPGEKKRLVIAALAEPSRMQGNGYEDRIFEPGARAVPEPSAERRDHPPGERRRGGSSARELEEADEGEKRVVRIKGSDERYTAAGKRSGDWSAFHLLPTFTAEDAGRYPDTGGELK
jgi:hypothetical protein